jgi:hypothetical protein
MKRPVAETIAKHLLDCLDQCNTAFNVVRRGVKSGALSYADPLGIAMMTVSRMLGTVFEEHPDLEPPETDGDTVPQWSDVKSYDYNQPISAIERTDAQTALLAVANAVEKLAQATVTVERECNSEDASPFLRGHSEAVQSLHRFVAILKQVHPDMCDPVSR